MRCSGTCFFLAVGMVVLLAHLALAVSSVPPEHRCIFDEIQGMQDQGSSARTLIADTAPVRGDQLQRDAAARSWSTLRISVFSLDMDDGSKYCTAPGDVRYDFLGNNRTCSEDEVLTQAKKYSLLSLILPSALAMHQERLLVNPLKNIKIIEQNMASNSVCAGYTYPLSHVTDGVSDTDFVLYLSAAPTSDGTIAWAAGCLVEGGAGRPVVGVANISPKYISSDERTVRIIVHEVLHALGFHSKYFNAAGISTQVNSVRDKTWLMPVLNSANVMAQVRAHYNCSALKAYEVEDTGGDQTARSHWKMRNAKDELMSPVVGAMIYSSITIAAMEDLGFYKGNYDKAEPMAYGHNVGCDFFARPCIVNGASLFPEEFCTESSNSVPLCTSVRTGLGSCQVGTLNLNMLGITSLPTWARYFGLNDYGGPYAAMDYCPYVTQSTSLYCNTGDSTQMPGSVISPASRCLVTNDNAAILFGGKKAKGICVDVKCDTNARTYKVRFRGSGSFVDCPEGSSVKPSGGAGQGGFDANPTVTVNCAYYDDVCAGNTVQVFGTAADENAADGLQNRGDAVVAPPKALWVVVPVVLLGLTVLFTV